MLKHLKDRNAYLNSIKEHFEGGAGSVTYTKEDFDKADKRIGVCMAVIQTNSPFFAVLIKKLLLVPSVFIPTMATDGNAILFNPKFTNSITEGECIFVLQHEILHCALKHFIRMEGRDPKLWNYATDYAINYMLQEMYNDSNPDGAKRLEGALYDTKYADMKAEDIYDKLLEEGFQPQTNMMNQKPGNQQCPSCGGSGEEQNQDQNQGEDGDQQGGGGDQEGDGQGQDQGGDQGGGDGQDGQDGDGQGSGGQGDGQDGDGQDGGGQGSGSQGDGQDGQGSGGHSHGQGGQPCKTCGGSGSVPGGGQPGEGNQQGVNPGDGWNVGGIATPEQLGKYYTDPDNPGKKPSGKELDKTWEVATKKAMKQAGNMPGNVKRMIGDILDPVINWKSQLKKFINSLAKKSQYKIPNRRHIHSGKYLPGMKRSMDGITNIIVGIDTSGSISDEMVRTYLSEVYDILKTFDPEQTIIHYIDTEIASTDIIKKKGKPDLNKIGGGGGTAFKPLFDWIDANMKPKDVSVVLYFTDLYGDTSFKKPKYYNKVIWVLEKDSRHLDVPWGKKLVLDKNYKIK
jgi:predicted metal-dependent peptidase